VSFTQFICQSQPFCLCVGHPNEWDECCCSASAQTKDVRCVGCNAPLILIDFDTGEPIAPEAAEAP
jgi:hypothetical protein